MNFIIFGAPGAGKGTQAKQLSAYLSIPQISTGDILRDSIQRKTDLGKKASEIMSRGELVPDDIMLEIIRERIGKPDCENGFILDGFPRTIPQAQGLDQLMTELRLPSFKCIEIKVSNEVIIDRLTSRKTCEKCGADYNPNVRPVPVDKICVVCGGNIISRQDDNVETIQNRLKVYKEKTEPVKNFYLQKGQFFEVDGNKSVDEVYNDIIDLVKKTE
jgi:adenylate kinase